MDWKNAIQRAQRGIREDIRLYVVAVSSLTIAFLCLAAALLVISNLNHFADHWGKTRRLTVYLRDAAPRTEIERLRLVLGDLQPVDRVEYLSSKDAKQQFLRDSDIDGSLRRLPQAAFPATLEVYLKPEVPVQQLSPISDRIRAFGPVEDVESYHGWFAKLEGLLRSGKLATGIVGLLVMFCVLAVVGNTIRLAVAGRKIEVEVMKLCGATDTFVRWPFVLEGALQGLAAATLALAVMIIGHVWFRGQIDAAMIAFTGVRTVFIHPAAVVFLMLSGAAAGAVGSSVSLRRYLSI